MGNQEESIKEKLAQKMAQDSKELIFAATALNISLMLFMTSFLLSIYALLTYFNFMKVEILSYLSLSALGFAILIGFLSIRFMKKKTKIYRDLSTVKEKVTKVTIFDPLIKQIKSEQLKMKKHVNYANSKFIQ